MVSRFFWIFGVGIPLYFLLFLGLVGLEIIPDFYSQFYDVSFLIPSSIETSILFIAVGGIGIAGLVWHYQMMGGRHGKHCEYTSFAELGLVGALIYIVLQFSVFENRPPFGTAEDFYTLIILSLIAGTMGVILYRFEVGKGLLPRFMR